MDLGGNVVDLLLAIAETPDMAISAVALLTMTGAWDRCWLTLVR
jgi:hypothetical protein